MATFFNQATLSYNGITLQSNTISGELVNILGITKNALEQTYTVNDEIVYTISIVNSGTTPFSNVSLTDTLGAYQFGAETLTPMTYESGNIQYYVNGVLQAQPTVEPGPPMIIEGINIPAGGNVVLIYKAKLNSYAPVSNGGYITNTVTATGAGINEGLSDADTINTSPDPVLSIVKSISPASVAEQGQITYTFTIENNSAAEANADADITVTDTFDPLLNSITVVLNGTTLALDTDYNYNTTTGEFSTVPGIITVPSAAVSQNAANGVINVTPGVSVLTVTGTV